ncbi:MAG TPA: DNA ligase D [Alphaproteobacteria bacterium]|nr:DNA ligase D [Alphaproteobacteria bacterium]
MSRTPKRAKRTSKPGATRSAHPEKARAKTSARGARAASGTQPALARYRKKRDFAKTPEPQGAREVKGDIYVIQKHAATRLHYDFRLALDDTLKSWAVAKGPSLNPNDRRLAAHVEDHPMDYARFEGIIPKGQYGGGTVMVWDFGIWEPIGDARAGYQKGHLEFVLHGEKLKGRWHLVKMKGRSVEEQRDYWLLIKGKDDEARDDGESILAKDRSVLSGRTMDQIARPAHGEPAVWQSNRTARTALRTEAQKLREGKLRAPPARGKAALPDFVPPELATLVDAPPVGGRWIHEVKLDGYRFYARIEDGRCRLLSRRGLDWTDRFPALARTLARTDHTAAIDGEVVFLDPKGVSDFGGLQDALSRGRTDEVALFAFDLLHVDGHDLRKLPLVERKERLKAFLAEAGYDPQGRPAVVYSEHFVTDGRQFLESACRMALEGIMSKRADAPYRSGRSSDWVKSKCRQRQEFVIGGYTDRANAPRHVGALLLGYYRDGNLVYAGKVGTGMNTATQSRVYKKLASRRIDRWPFSERPPERSGVTWVRPELVCEIEFHGWTRDGRIRQGSFQGLRLDKTPAEVVREQAAHMSDVAARSSEDTPMAKGRKPTATSGTSRAKPGASRAASVAPPLPDDMPRLTNPDRVLLPEQGLSKRQIVDYYVAVADHLLPHIVDRPLTVIRCTQGQDRCFYQKHPMKGMSEAIRRFPIREKNKTEDYIVVDNLKGVVELVQFGSLELNPWGSTTKHIEKPDRIIFDLDPDPSVSWDVVIAAMQEVREALDTVGLASFPKTTGGKGLHVTVPIEPRHPWPVVKEFARTFAEYLARRAPDRYTTNMSKARRKGRIFIDYLRNDRGATAVAPYSTRARKGGAVAVPLSWREVTAKLDPSSLTADVVVTRLKKLRADPWEGYFDLRQRIDELSPGAAESPTAKRRRA